MTEQRFQLSLSQIEEMPPESLAFELLAHLDPKKWLRRTHSIGSLVGQASADGQASYSEVFSRYPQACVALAEAWQHLVVNGLMVQWPPTDPRYSSDGVGDMYQMTSWGRSIRSQPQSATSRVAARRRLGIDLHPSIASRVRDSVAVGDFEQAGLTALRAIEARVRKLCGDPRGGRGERLTGVALMQHAFKPEGGPLSDRHVDPGERVGMMNLFAGAFGAIRNALAHTEVEWSDATEAAEYVLLADLLMRMIDRAESLADPLTS